MRSGKDTLAKLLYEHYGISYISSSMAAVDFFIYDILSKKYGYKTKLECFNDRVNHRKEWYELILEWNRDDKSRLAKSIIEKFDCYVGMRDRSEFLECKKREIFDLVIWVDSSERSIDEPSTSFNIKKSDADIIIDNNRDLNSLISKMHVLGKLLKPNLLG